MSFKITEYSAAYEADYNRLMTESPVGMFNHSLPYRAFLQSILPGTENHYFCAFDDDELVAALPVFVKTGIYGAVVNSLPFYGSHGGIIYRQGTEPRVFMSLLETLAELCNRLDAFSCTLIESPLDKQTESYSHFSANLFDSRIGQITSLPLKDGDGSLDDRLLTMCHQKTRNMIRKGLRGGFEVSHDGSMATLQVLHAIHEGNIKSIGGQPKPLDVFRAIAENFEYNKDYRIYLAIKNGLIAAALLLFYFKDTVEYFTPATLESYRSDQPMSLLIYSAMKDAIIERDARNWNWGGTWISQSGVYQFKSRWGTKDYPYRYHIKTNPALHILNVSKNELFESYPYFYSLPFSIFD